MTTNHTPGRLQAIHGSYLTIVGTTESIGRCGNHGPHMENARRLAACWNACIDVDTETLIQHPAPFSELRAERDALRAQVEALTGGREAIAEAATILANSRKMLKELTEFLPDDPQPPLTRPAVPEGWKLVPVEPTEDMLVNVDQEVGGHCYSCTKWKASWDDCRAIWKEMLEAAPQPDPHASCPPPVDEIEAAEREHMGCVHCKTGIYAPREAAQPKTQPIPDIKGASISGGYVIVTPAGWGDDKAPALRDAILKLFPVNPKYQPRPAEAGDQKGGV